MKSQPINPNINMKNIAIFASGSGTNAQCIAEYFSNTKHGKVALILSNNKNAYVLKRAENLGIPTHVFNRDEFYKSEKVLEILNENDIKLNVLAGFLWLIPDYLLKEYPNRIVNIHPALLPKYGGKGMFGARVHEAIIESGDKETGITIHLVNEKYDEGEILFQDKIRILADDTPDTIAQKVHKLEYKHYPMIIERLLMQDKN